MTPRLTHVVLGLGAFALVACSDDSPTALRTLSPGDLRLATAPTTGPNQVPVANLVGTTSYPLYAGGGGGSTGTQVGVVNVTSSGTDAARTFNVTYQASPGYCFSEAHLDITGGEASELAGKNGNPAPGQFAYKWSGACTSTVSFPNLGPYALQSGNSFVIAAHAVVKGTGSAFNGANYVSGGTLATTIVNRRSGNVAGWQNGFVPHPAALVQIAGTDAQVWNTNQGILDPAAEPQADGAWLLNAGAQWVWETSLSQDPVQGTVIQMQVSTPSVPVATTGVLRITCDNGYRLVFGGMTISTDVDYPDASPANTRSSLAGITTQLDPMFDLVNSINLRQPFVSSDGWQSVESYNVNLAAGVNTFTIYGVNEYHASDDQSYFGVTEPPGTQQNNPAGCIYGIQANAAPGGPGIGSETAWGAPVNFGGSYGEPGNFSGKNWATFIYYRTK